MEQLAFEYIGKVCTKCGKWKPLDDFHRHAHGKYGRVSKCKECVRAYGYHYRKKYRDEISVRNRQRYKDDYKEYCHAYRIKNRERIAEYMKVYKVQYRARNLERRRAYSRQYYVEHRKERLAYHRKWAAENRDVANAAKINYRTRKKDNEGSFTAQEWKDLCEKYGNKCLCCDATDKPLTHDHVIPISKGGSSNIENLQPLCKSCNASKRDQIFDYRID